MKLKRTIINLSKPIIEIYKISDEYVIECSKNKTIIDYDLFDYLESSIFEVILLDQYKDIFDGNFITHYESLRTDGYWLWSADLNIYYKKNNFKWPNSFIDDYKLNKLKQLKEEEVHNKCKKFIETIINLQFGKSNFEKKIPYIEIFI